ncbi:site-specific integrase [Paenisporosarcina indica]|uniref:site-specific integrase n=1 Tax=Paenisporosarcina indica TaxID=650093 RepID=UPI00094F8BFD|nr:phage integrase N-terminal SAM-like domain-containing protein [Paenisporosarcina indica]
MLLSKAWEGFESDKRIEGFSPQTLKAYQHQFSLLIEYFKDAEITTLETNHLKEYLATSWKHLKPASLAHRIRFLKSVFRWSHKKAIYLRFQQQKLKNLK